MLRVGLISDTHGLLRPEATAFLRGSDYIVHGGDIGAPSILEQLTSIAPVTAVRGNNDTGPWAESLPEAVGALAHPCVDSRHWNAGGWKTDMTSAIISSRLLNRLSS